MQMVDVPSVTAFGAQSGQFPHDRGIEGIDADLSALFLYKKVLLTTYAKKCKM